MTIPSVWSDEAGPVGAPLVVLIHGSMDRSTGLLRLSRRLDERFRVLRYDRRGYSRSADEHGAHPGPFDMPSQVADLVGLLRGRPALLIGHSFGGNVALALAAQHPHLARGVALYETPLSWEPWWPGTTAGAAAVASEGLPADAAERFMRRLIGDARWENLPEKTRVARRAEGSAMVGELRDLQANRPWVAAAIGCPVVLGFGQHGADHHQVGMRHLHQCLPGSQLFELEACRHDAPMSNAALFADVLVGALVDATR